MFTVFGFYKFKKSNFLKKNKELLQREILKRATIYSDEDKAKNFKPYIATPKVGKGD